MVVRFFLFVLCLDEEIIYFLVIVDFFKREVDVSIFRNFGLKYGLVVWFKIEFLDISLVCEFSFSLWFKLIMGEMFGFNLEMKRLYLLKYVDFLLIFYGS